MATDSNPIPSAAQTDTQRAPGRTTAARLTMILALVALTVLPGCGIILAILFGNSDGDMMDPFVPGKPLTRFQSADFTGSGICADCHNGLTDAAGNDVSIPDQWRATMMANAAKDPFFRAKLASERLRHPGHADDLEASCARCHTPMATVQAMVNGADVKILGDGFADPNNPLHEPALDGVSCTLCHQVQPDNLGTDASYSGGYEIDTTTSVPDRVIFGPFADPEVATMQETVGFTPAEGVHMFSSELCATCHTLFTPVLDDMGDIVGEFPEQTPYLEWLHSDFGDGNADDQSCQHCHMPLAVGDVIISRLPANGLSPRGPFFEHHFVGGNVFMLRILRANIEELGLTASTTDFDATIGRTLDQLQIRTATLGIASSEIQDDTIVVEVVVTNLAGHKFPTGYPARRAWIHVVVEDAGGAIVFESGRPIENGAITGNAADADAQVFEPHHRLITNGGEVQIYEAVMENSGGEVTYSLLSAAAYAKDNRLLPRGFDKSTADPEIAPAGLAMTDDDFVAGEDRVTYEASLGVATGPFIVTANLYYQSIGFRFLEDLRQDTTTEGDAFLGYYDAADNAPILVATASAVVGEESTTSRPSAP